MFPCARTIIWQRILIRKHLFWSDHVVIHAVPYGLTDRCVPHLHHFLCLFLPFFLAGVWKSICDPTMPKISKIKGRTRTEQLMELVRENVALYDQSSDDCSSTSSLKHTVSINSFEWTCTMTDRGGHSPLYIQPKMYTILYAVIGQRGAGITCLLERQTHDRKVVRLIPSRSGGRIFFFWVNFVCWLVFSVCSTPVLPQWHIKGPVHSAKSVDGRLHLNMHTPLTQRSWSGLTMLLPRHSVGTYPVTNSHTTHQGTLSHSHLSSLSHCGLILA